MDIERLAPIADVFELLADGLGLAATENQIFQAHNIWFSPMSTINYHWKSLSCSPFPSLNAALEIASIVVAAGFTGAGKPSPQPVDKRYQDIFADKEVEIHCRCNVLAILKQASRFGMISKKCLLAG